MPPSTTISAVIALYNPDPCFLKLAIESVLSQSYPVLELVLVNDGGEMSVIESVLPGDDRIKLYTKNNGGVADARNYAIERCMGDYVAFLDQDDYWYPEKIAELLARIPSTGMACMVVAPVDIIDESGSIDRKRSSEAEKTFSIKLRDGNVLRGLVTDNFIHSSSPLIHRSIFGTLGGFDTRVQPHDDWDMYLRIAIAGYPVFFDDHSRSVWRIHASNESGNVASMQRSMCRVYRKNLPAIRDIPSRKLFYLCGLLTSMNRAGNLLYKPGRYRLFRKHVGKAMAMAMKTGSVPQLKSAGASLLIWEFKTLSIPLIKSIRRYLFCLVAVEKHRDASPS
ncbi:MAG: glycosyltransferase [Chlorobiaceae bacterium]|nr:glycosyltransferase [Chlorobiaceae bacterium]